MQKQALLQWNNLSDTDSSPARLRMMECLVHSSDNFVSSDSFDQKFPSYARSAAIMQPLGIVSADQSAWKTNDCKEALKLDACKHRMPALYRSSTYKPVIVPFSFTAFSRMKNIPQKKHRTNQIRRSARCPSCLQLL
ncbi:MAG: hypothetical protein LKK26_08545 [Solobacterium sp.]|jgi:hypothetical protein|nr:hypothetical protein [Solobacterium sp.]